MATDINIIVGVQSGDALRQLGNVRKQVDGVGAATKRTSGALKQHANQYNKTAVSVNKFGKGAMQQAGYQVAVFAVQLQNGTSFLQAFGQQGSQMLAVFGPIGAVLGAGVAVASALGTVFTKASGSIKDTSTAFGELSQSVDIYRRAVDRAMMPSDELLNSFGKHSEKIREQLNLIRSMKATDAIDLLKISVSSLSAEMAELSGDALFFKDIMEQTEGAARVAGDMVEDLAGKFGLSSTQLSILTKSLANIEKASTLDEVVTAGENFRKVLLMIYEDTSKIPPEMRNIVSQVFQASVTAADLSTSFDKVATGASSATESVKKLKVEIPKIPPEIQRINDAANMVGSSFERSMMSMVKGTATARDAFRAMAADIISELYRIFVVKQITGFITSSIQSAFMPREYSAPPSAPRATGGPVSAGSPYLVGERGPELMIPSRSGTIIPNNKLGGGGGVVVNQTINVSTGVQQTVRAEIKQLMPQIADSAKAAVVDAKRRGGSYGRAFA